jgi:hypothetical protein
MCPLCRVAHKADREYIWHFYDEGADQGDSIDELRRSCGCLLQHRDGGAPPAAQWSQRDSNP